MARLAIEDCEKRIPCRFLLVLLAAFRVRSVRRGSPFLVDNKENSDIVRVLREIAQGKIRPEDLKAGLKKEILTYFSANGLIPADRELDLED